jgi:capsular polysaccharide biosynthesis protein
MNSNKSEIQIREIDLWEILDLIWKKKMIILLVTVLTAAASWAGTKYFIEPKYRANFTVFVNNR